MTRWYISTPSATVDKVVRACSLRPHSREGHLVLYENVLHNPDKTLPFWLLEAVARDVGIGNCCDYSLDPPLCQRPPTDQ